MRGCVHFGDHDVFVLKAIVEQPTIFAVPLSRPMESFRECEVFVLADRPGPGAALSGAPLCFVERELGDDICFYSDATKTTELLRVTARRRYDRTAEGAFRKMASFVGLAGRTYDVTQGDGAAIGVIHKDFGQRRYSYATPPTYNS